MTKDNSRGADLRRIESQAVVWAQKLASGEARADEIEAAKHWRADDPAHETAFAAAQAVWRDLGAARDVLHDPGTDYATALDALGRRRKTVSRRLVLGGGAAAVATVAAYGIVRPPLGMWPSLSQLNADFRTATGEQRNVTFAGDIAINLNTQTSLAICQATPAENRIELITGEASFDMTQRGTRMLAVLAGAGQAVTDAGRFDIRYTTDGDRSPVTVTCFDGRVRVEQGGASAELRTGQRIRYTDAGMSDIAAVDPVAESNWQRGIVEFRNTPVVEVVEEINRYRPGRIILMSATLAHRQINGRFRVGEMDEVLVQLQQAVDAKLRYLPGGVVLLS
ncbi:FecR family protein [Bradyrhizobium cenepequi]